MNTKVITRLLIGIGVLVLVVYLTFQVIAGITIGDMIGGGTRDDLTLTEAQSLLPFQICLPKYIPDGLERKELLVVSGELVSMGEIDVRIDYISSGSKKQVITLKEYHVPNTGRKIDLYDESIRKKSVQSLLAWLFDYDWEKVEGIIDEVVVRYKVYNNNDTEYLIVEIQEPLSLKSQQIYWEHESVGFEVSSRLSVDEAIKIADSMPICEIVPTPMSRE